MERKLLKINEVTVLLAGDGNPPLSQAAVGLLVKQGMPKAGRGFYDATACLHWYIGQLRRRAFLSVLRSRMRAVVDHVADELANKPGTDFEKLWREQVAAVFEGLGA